MPNRNRNCSNFREKKLDFCHWRCFGVQRRERTLWLTQRACGAAFEVDELVTLR
jgi:hypothetical protein